MQLFEKKGPLRVGFYTEIKGVHSHPACVRAVMEAKVALEGKGYKVSLSVTGQMTFLSCCC